MLVMYPIRFDRAKPRSERKSENEINRLYKQKFNNSALLQALSRRRTAWRIAIH